LANGKLYAFFRFVSKSTTLDDLVNLELPLRTLFHITSVFGARHENLNEDRPILSAYTVYSLQYKVDGDIRGVQWRGASNHSVVVENGNFQYFRSLFLQKL